MISCDFHESSRESIGPHPTDVVLKVIFVTVVVLEYGVLLDATSLVSFDTSIISSEPSPEMKMGVMKDKD